MLPFSNQLTHKVIRFTLLTVTLVFLIITVLSYHVNRETELISLRNYVDHVNEAISVGIVDPLVNKNYTHLEELLRLYTAYPNIAQIDVYAGSSLIYRFEDINADGDVRRVVSVTEPRPVFESSQRWCSNADGTDCSDNFCIDRDFLYVTHPMTSLGFPALMISVSYKLDSVKSRLQMLLYFSALGLISALLFSWLVIRYLLAPISRDLVRLRQFLTVFGVKYDDKLIVESDIDELLVLASAFQKQQETLKRANDAILEERNALLLNKEELVDAINVAEGSVKARSAFLANMSHEIRTPLNGILGLNTLLLKTDLNRQQEEFVTKSLQSSKALLNIINDILDYSKIDAGKLELVYQPFSLEDLIRSSVSLFEYSAQQKRLAFYIDYDTTIPPLVEGDSLRLSQVFNNLIGNAIKFTDTGSITICAKLAKQIDDQLCIQCSVRDTGIGMNGDELKKLFQPFSQTDISNTRKYGGTGLGLMISQQLIHLMQGNIWVESIKGEGSTFFFNLFVGCINYENPLLALETLRSKCFMVVDDNPVDRQIVSKILTAWRLRVIVCASGKEAIEIVKTTPIDYLLLDWLMPNMDGIDVLEQLHLHYVGTFPKVIMMTASVEDDLLLKEQAIHIYPDMVLNKPITPSQLLEAILHKQTYIEIVKQAEICLPHFSGLVLVAEDNEVNQLVIKEYLEDVGVDVDVVANGLEAVVQSQQKPYNLILMDLQMPVMDGFDASKKIRLLDTNIPIVALSAAVLQKDKALTLAAGMNGHLAKPIELQQLYQVLEKYLRVSCDHDNEKSSNNDQVNQGQTIESSEPSLSSVLPDEASIFSVSSITGIDMAKLVQVFKKPEKIARYLETFSKTQRNLCVNLESVELLGREFKQMIHSLKGVSGNIYAVHLHQLCKMLEAEDDHNKALQLKNELCLELTNIINSIDHHYSSIIPSPDNLIIVPKKVVISMLDEIFITVQDRSLVSDDVLNRLVLSLMPYVEQSLLSSLSEAIQLFDFMTAGDIIIRLKEELERDA